MELFLIDAVMVFHKTGEATEKERSPKLLSRVLGTAIKFFSAVRRLLRLGLLADIKSDRQPGTSELTEDLVG